MRINRCNDHGGNGFKSDCGICREAKSSPASSGSADMVNHPPHYTAHPSGVECIAITEHMGFCVGNAVKYLWRADEKGAAVEDLEKSRWYIEREIALRKAKQNL